MAKPTKKGGKSKGKGGVRVAVVAVAVKPGFPALGRVRGKNAQYMSDGDLE